METETIAITTRAMVADTLAATEGHSCDICGQFIEGWSTAYICPECASRLKAILYPEPIGINELI